MMDDHKAIRIMEFYAAYILLSDWQDCVLLRVYSSAIEKLYSLMD